MLVARSSPPPNGGSADYAFDGETALVCGPDAEEMAEALVRLVTDDDLRVRIADERMPASSNDFDGKRALNVSLVSPMMCSADDMHERQ